jgi:osmotically-inducible protein OsmY
MPTLDDPMCELEEASATAIVEAAESCLRKNAYLVLRNISCEFRGGVLTLRGCLPTYYLKQIAQSVVLGVAGVERIDNQILVRCSPAASR